MWTLDGNEWVRAEFEERAAIIEYHGGHGRGGAELFAYAMTIERVHSELTLSASMTSAVALQLDRARRIRNHHAKGYVG